MKSLSYYITENNISSYYGEVSGAIEHYFKKYNGYPIPNIYVPDILNKQDIILSDDGFHYKRKIGINFEETAKCMFGFADEEIYNELMNNYLDYIGFRKAINTDTELYESTLYKYPPEILKAISIIELIKDYHEENDLNELF